MVFILRLNIGYSGDVWYPQPAPKDHPWRYMPNQAMTPHISGTTIDAQVFRYGSINSTVFFKKICSMLQDFTHIGVCITTVQLRYAAGVKDMLDRYFKGEDFPAQHYIVKEGELAPQYR